MDALRIVDQLKPNTIIVDVDLPDIDGIGLVERRYVSAFIREASL